MTNINQSSHPSRPFEAVAREQSSLMEHKRDELPPFAEQNFFAIYSNLPEAPFRRGSIRTVEHTRNVHSVKASGRADNTKYRKQRSRGN